MKDNNILHMNTRPDVLLESCPSLKNKLPLVPDGTAILSHHFVKALSDGEFIVLASMNYNFKCAPSVLKLIKERMIKLGISYETGNNNQSLKS